MEIKNILDELKILNVRSIELTGGEPLLREDLNDIIKYAKILRFQVKILTNGSLLNRNILENFKRIGVDKIAISMDGVRYPLYKKTRPVKKAVFSKVINNIKLAGSFGIFVKINSVIVKSNIGCMQEIIDFCESNNINELRFCYFTKKGRGSQLDESVPPRLWMKEIKKLESKKIPVYFGYSFAPMARGCLLKNIFPLYISGNGDVFLCPMLGPMGNIREEKLNDIINRGWDKKSCLGSKKEGGLKPTCPLRKYNIKQI